MHAAICVRSTLGKTGKRQAATSTPTTGAQYYHLGSLRRFQYSWVHTTAVIAM